MDAKLFLLFSSMEWLALLVLTFAMFKFPIPGHRGQLLFTSFLLSLVSYLVFVIFKLYLYGPLIQLPIVFLFFRLYFRVHVFYAGLMVVNGYLSYVLIQDVIAYLFDLSGADLKPDTQLAFIIQAITAVMVFAVAGWVRKENAGFTFIPEANRMKLTWNRLHVKLLIMTFLGYAGISCHKFVIKWEYAHAAFA